MPDETQQPQPQPEPPPQPQTPSSPEPPPAETRSASDAWVGAAVWVVVAAVVGYVWFFSGRADVVLNVSGTDPLVVEGRVTSGGAPAPSGIAHVLVEDPRGERLLASATGDVDAKGAFKVEFKSTQLTGLRTDGLRVTSQYKGRAGNDEIDGSAIVYVNMTPPWRIGWGAAVVIAVLLILATLFTGPLSPRKARVLFALTYLVTFSACVIPILLTVLVSQSPYMLEMMQNAPIGILKARAKGLEQPQWLVNIGGFVTPAQTATVPANPPPVKPTPAPAPPAATPPKAPDNTTASATASEPADTTTADAAAKPVTSDAPAKPDANAPATPATLQVLGGLAIPLYVLVLAMFGAGINMTRKVPEIQNDYDSNAPATLMGALTAPAAFIGLFTGGSARLGTADQSGIRQKLIETYMYFLSAPFLAVAVYYLLQVIATSVAEPVLVVIAFATGLMSNTAVGAIMAFADSWLAKAQKPSPPQQQEQKEPTPPKTKT